MMFRNRILLLESAVPFDLLKVQFKGASTNV